MPLETAWYAEPQIRIFNVIGAINQSNFNEVLKSEIEVLKISPVKIHYIIDAENMGSFAVNPLAAAPILEFLGHPNLGWLGMVGNSTILNYWAQILDKVAQIRLRPFPTIDDAASFLNDMIKAAQDPVPDPESSL